PRRAADAGNAWKARRALRAQRVHPGRHLERRLVRSVGSRAGEGAGPTDHSGARERERAHARPRQLDEQHDPSLQEAEDYEMTTVGFDHPLYVLPFDHRGSFQTTMFGWNGALSPEQTAQIAAFQPTFCKVLVRYNPESDPALNRRQAVRLKRLSQYLHDKSRSRFMFELLVPAEKTQLERLGGDTKAYDLELRPPLMVQAI